LKILFILGSPNPSPGAAWTRIGFFAEAWSRKGHLVDVLGTFSYKSLWKRGMRKTGRVNIFNIVFNIGLNHPLIFTLNSIVSVMVSTLFLLAKKPDVTVVSVPSGNVGFGALMACKLLKAKCIVDYRDEWEDYAISSINSRDGKSYYSAIKKLTASLYKKCRFVVTVTPNFIYNLKSRGVTKVKLVPNGADVRIFKPLNNRKENKIFKVFYSGSIGGYYRLDVAVNSIKKLANNGVRNVKLTIAGRGEIEKVLRLAYELNVSNNIEYREEINDKTKLADLIANADVGLIPYDNNPLWKNSLPAKLFEYCACGIPILATVYEDSILAKLIEEHEVGLIAPPMNVERLAEAIYRFCENGSFRKASGERARALIEEKFDRNKISGMFLSLVEQVVHSPS